MGHLPPVGMMFDFSKLHWLYITAFMRENYAVNLRYLYVTSGPALSATVPSEHTSSLTLVRCALFYLFSTY